MSSMSPTFTSFPKLPPELRNLIWRLSLPSRTVMASTDAPRYGINGRGFHAFYVHSRDQNVKAFMLPPHFLTCFEANHVAKKAYIKLGKMSFNPKKDKLELRRIETSAWRTFGTQRRRWDSFFQRFVEGPLEAERISTEARALVTHVCLVQRSGLTPPPLPFSQLYPDALEDIELIADFRNLKSVTISMCKFPHKALACRCVAVGPKEQKMHQYRDITPPYKVFEQNWWEFWWVLLQRLHEGHIDTSNMSLEEAEAISPTLDLVECKHWPNA